MNVAVKMWPISKFFSQYEQSNLIAHDSYTHELPRTSPGKLRNKIYFVLGELIYS